LFRRDGCDRREFIVALGSAPAWPVVARAQQPAIPVVGFLGSGSPDKDTNRVRALRQGLSETSYVEGKNVAIEYRWAEDQNDRLPALAADLVRRQVSVIATTSTLPALAAKAATTTIPIVFEVGYDPVELGLVASLTRPGGNLTGTTTLASQLGPKRLELLHEVVPTATIMALLVNPTSPSAAPQSREVQAAARTLGLQLHVLHVSTERELETVFATLAQLRAGALVIAPHAFFSSKIEQLAALTLRHAVPAIYEYRQFVAAGGLMSYGSDLAEALRLVGNYTGRILKGEKPADLPVQQATKVELFINLKTAKTLGLTVPLVMQMTADVIE
jgi:putative tryptophan/tyrosine transport system substrate-binding protein